MNLNWKALPIWMACGGLLGGLIAFTIAKVAGA